MKTTLYIPGNSIIHGFDPRTKMAMIIFSMMMAFAYFNPTIPLIVIVTMSIVLILAIGKEFLKSAFVQMIPIMVLTVVILHTFTNPAGKTPIQIGGTIVQVPYFDKATWEGLYFGIVYSLRIASVYLCSMMLVLTTTPEQMVSSIVKMRIPFKYASMFGTSLQMIPILQEEAGIIIQAQRARALREDNFKQKIQSLVPLFVPLAVGAMQQAETTAMVLGARGFGAPVKRTELHEIKFKWVDYLMMFAALTITAVVLYLRIAQGDINWVGSVRSVPGLFWPIQP